MGILGRKRSQKRISVADASESVRAITAPAAGLTVIVLVVASGVLITRLVQEGPSVLRGDLLVVSMLRLFTGAALLGSASLAMLLWVRTPTPKRQRWMSLTRPLSLLGLVALGTGVLMGPFGSIPGLIVGTIYMVAQSRAVRRLEKALAQQPARSSERSLSPKR